MRIPLEQSTIRATVSPPKTARKRKTHTHPRAVAVGVPTDAPNIVSESTLEWKQSEFGCSEPGKRLADSVQSRSLADQTMLQFTPIHHRHRDPEEPDTEEDEDDDDDEEEENSKTNLVRYPIGFSRNAPRETADGFGETTTNAPLSSMSVSLYDPISPMHAGRRGRTSSGTNLLIDQMCLSPQNPPVVDATSELCTKTPVKKLMSDALACSESSVVNDPTELASRDNTSVESPTAFMGGRFARPDASHMPSDQFRSSSQDTDPNRSLSPSCSSPVFKYSRIVKRPDTLIPTQANLNTSSISLQQRTPFMRAKVQTFAKYGKLPARFASPSPAVSCIEINYQLSVHRSLSTSNLFSVQNRRKFEVTGSPESVKATVISIPPVSSSSGRLQSPVLKFHKNFTNKRQSLSAEDLPWLIKQPKVSFLIPTSRMEVTDPDVFVIQKEPICVRKSLALSSSQSFTGKDSGAFLHSSQTDSLSESKPPRSPLSLTRLELTRSSNSLPEPIGSKSQLAATTQRSPASITPVVYHKLMTRTSLFSSVTYPWTERVSCWVCYFLFVIIKRFI